MVQAKAQCVLQHAAFRIKTHVHSDGTKLNDHILSDLVMFRLVMAMVVETMIRYWIVIVVGIATNA